jgi:hypothetical protein
MGADRFGSLSLSQPLLTTKAESGRGDPAMLY